MIWFYRILFLPLFILSLPYYLQRMMKRGGYERDFSHRFGFLPELPGKKDGVSRIWIQAVSVGELLAIEPILTALKENESVEVFLTTTTSTGYVLAKEKYGDLVMRTGYFPWDFWPCSACGWRRVDPDLIILTEGELWPEHLHQAKKRMAKVLLINARLSDHTYDRLKSLNWAIGGVLKNLTYILAGSDSDAERFRDLGVEASKVVTTGNIKVDFEMGERLLETEKIALRKELGLGERLVLLGSSVWPGEEEVLLELFMKAREEQIDCQLFLVPRHAERREDIRRLLTGTALSHHFRSEGPAEGQVDVAVGDTTGELRKFAQVADLVFVGKSLPPHREGQTPIETAAFGKPLLFGPEMSNFRSIARTLVRCGAAVSVKDAEDLKQKTIALLKDRESCQKMGKAGVLWHQSSRGAVGKTVACIENSL
jgi:3-deoxy-D-manno-octulosonic-acid transferase